MELMGPVTSLGMPCGRWTIVTHMNPDNIVKNTLFLTIFLSKTIDLPRFPLSTQLSSPVSDLSLLSKLAEN